MKPHIMLPFEPITLRADTCDVRSFAYPQRPCRLHYLFLDPSPPYVLNDWMVTGIYAGHCALLAISAGGLPASAFALPGIMRYTSAALVDGYVKIDVSEDARLPPRFRSDLVRLGMAVEVRLRLRDRIGPAPAPDWTAQIHPVMLGAAEDRF